MVTSIRLVGRRSGLVVAIVSDCLREKSMLTGMSAHTLRRSRFNAHNAKVGSLEGINIIIEIGLQTDQR